MKSLDEIAKQIIAKNIYCTISTATKDGDPWGSPMYYYCDPSYTFYWLSATNAHHSQLIRENSEIVITIFDTHTPFGSKESSVYIKADAREVNDKKTIETILPHFYRGLHKPKHNEFSHFLDNSPRRFYEAKPTKLWALGKALISKGHYVDQRIELQLAEFYH